MSPYGVYLSLCLVFPLSLRAGGPDPHPPGPSFIALGTCATNTTSTISHGSDIITSTDHTHLCRHTDRAVYQGTETDRALTAKRDEKRENYKIDTFLFFVVHFPENKTFGLSCSDRDESY